MKTTAGQQERIVHGFGERHAAAVGLKPQAGAIAQACEAMADRFRRGGRLLAFGNGASTTDAQHVAVEFVHPVLVGKPALPAMALTPDALEAWAQPTDIVMALTTEARDDSLHGVLRLARQRGMLTLALAGADSRLQAEHVIQVPSRDRLILKELQVTVYHILWELVHVFLQSGADNGLGVGNDLAFLYGGQTDRVALLESIERSTVAKMDDILALRDLIGQQMGEPMLACAGAVESRLGAGARLFTMGNGGSATDAQTLAWLFVHPPSGRSRPALCLTSDVAVLTALSNDVSFDVVFARQLAAQARAGDVVVGISTSGNSHNLLQGFEQARRLGLLTVGLAGASGGKMAEVDTLDFLFTVPSTSIHRIQEAQTTLYQLLWDLSHR